MPAVLRLHRGDEESTSAPPDAQLPFDPIEDPNLSKSAAATLWGLCKWAWFKQSDCWPSNLSVARTLKCCKRTVQYHIAELVENGYLERRMTKTDTGWRRVLRFTNRVAAVKIHLPDEVAPGAKDCTTPVQKIAPPPCNPLHPNCIETEREKIESGGVACGGGPPTPPEAQGRRETSRPADPGLPTSPPSTADVLDPKTLAVATALLASRDGDNPGVVAALFALKAHNGAIDAGLAPGLHRVDLRAVANSRRRTATRARTSIYAELDDHPLGPDATADLFREYYRVQGYLDEGHCFRPSSERKIKLAEARDFARARGKAAVPENDPAAGSPAKDPRRPGTKAE